MYLYVPAKCCGIYGAYLIMSLESLSNLNKIKGNVELFSDLLDLLTIERYVHGLFISNGKHSF